MSRLLLLFVCLIWLAGATQPPAAAVPSDQAVLLAAGLGSLVGLVLLVAAWSRLVARRVSARTFSASVRRLGWVMLISRLYVVAGFAAAVFGLGWVDFVEWNLGLGSLGSARLPSLVVGILPALAGWVGLWWAYFPADRALRQQGLAENLLDGLPVHHPPGLGAYLALNFRLQVLFTLAPLLMIVGLRDVGTALAFPASNTQAARSVDSPGDREVGRDAGHDRDAGAGRRRAEVEPFDAQRDRVEGAIWFASIGLVYLVAPELLRRILPTSPLRDGPLRRRLEALCRRSGMRCRDILVWHTHHNVGNAAVMGILPRVRYVLLSDLLLERMADEQIEAVFAHEIGHVVHRHMAWYVVFFFCFVLMSAAAGMLAPAAPAWVGQLPLSAGAWTMAGLTAAATAFLTVFGFVSRRFERQADVYAARMMEAVRPADAAVGAARLAPFLGDEDFAGGGRRGSATATATRPAAAEAVGSAVGAYGAHLFASTLHRVAVINNIPLNPRHRRGTGLMHHVSHLVGSLTDLAHDWLHDSIPNRMAYLRALGEDPELTGRFDRVMARLYGAMLFMLVASAAYLVPTLAR